MLGVDYFIDNYKHLKKCSFGLLTNHATFSASGYPVAFELIRQGYKIKKLFSPEHGILSQAEDGLAQENTYDAFTRLPIVSLYGEKFRPQSIDLEDIDIILIDLPNVGCRFYTYLWTITYMIEACATSRKKVILLDRPNLSQRSVDGIEGPMLDMACHSFLGRWPMPLTFSQSFGQLLRWFVYQREINIEFEVVHFNDGQLSFIPPSPSINELQAVWMYPCTGLFEGLNLNSGRGTAFPFRVIGAPWLNAVQLCKDIKASHFDGLDCFPYSYKPTWSRYANTFCHGLYFHVNDNKKFQPVKTALWLIKYLSVHYSSELQLEVYPTAANPGGEKHFDLLVGIPNAYSQICKGYLDENIQPARLTDVSGWYKSVETFLTSS